MSTIRGRCSDGSGDGTLRRGRGTLLADRLRDRSKPIRSCPEAMEDFPILDRSPQREAPRCVLHRGVCMAVRVLPIICLLRRTRSLRPEDLGALFLFR